MQDIVKQRATGVRNKGELKVNQALTPSSVNRQ